MRASARIALLLLALPGFAACADEPREPLRLQSGLVTVDNQSDDEWRNVEIWLNNYYRAIASSVPPHSILQVRVDTFVSGYGHRFDGRRAQVTDLRLKGSRKDGETFELKKPFKGDPLKDAVGGNP